MEKVKGNLDSLVLLRFIAVVSVVFCHFGDPLSSGNHYFSPLFTCFHDYGKYGVHIFFVISGFVIPLSLYHGGYTIKKYLIFLYKRILRLHPPYLVALAITLIIMYGSYKYRHLPFPENWLTILKSIFYFHVPADNPVFWTLIVEAQYYIFIGIFYYFLRHYYFIACFCIIPFIFFLGYFFGEKYLLIQPYIEYFLIGNVVFTLYTKTGEIAVTYIMLIFLFSFMVYNGDYPAIVSSLIAVLFILFYKLSIPKVTQFIGNISYSIYLIHFPVGIKFINLVKPKFSPSNYWILFIITCIITITLSYIFFIVIESFSEKISKKIKYKSSV